MVNKDIKHYNSKLSNENKMGMILTAMKEDSVNRTTSSDETSMHEKLPEIYQMILNSTRAEYDTMFERRAISEYPYRMLSASCDFMEEAISGELLDQPFFTEDNGLIGIADKDAYDQMLKCAKVGWEFLDW